MQTLKITAIAALFATSAYAAPVCDVDLKVRTNENFHSRADIQHFLDVASSVGITSVEMTVKMDEDDGRYTGINSGYVFYASNIAPRAKGYENFDALQVMIEEAHARNISVTAWLPQFHDKAAMERYPNWQMMAYNGRNIHPYLGGDRNEYFINPVHADARAYQIALIQEVARYDIDGLAIDWVRFDDWHMDLSDYTRQIYLSKFGIDPVTIDFDSDTPEAMQWNTFRTGIIAEHVITAARAAKAINPDLQFGIHALPAEMVEVAQDAAQFGTKLDYIAPLAYYDDWGFSQNWVWATLIPDMLAKTGGLPIYPALDDDWSNRQSQTVVDGIKQYSNVQKISWFTYEKWTDRKIKRVMSFGFCE